MKKMFKFSSLQPHNILLASKENSAPIKIADFGIATEIGEEGYVTSGKKKWMKLLLLLLWLLLLLLLLLLAEVQLYVWFSPILQKENHVQTMNSADQAFFCKITFWATRVPKCF